MEVRDENEGFYEMYRLGDERYHAVAYHCHTCTELVCRWFVHEENAERFRRMGKKQGRICLSCAEKMTIHHSDCGI